MVVAVFVHAWLGLEPAGRNRDGHSARRDVSKVCREMQLRLREDEVCRGAQIGGEHARVVGRDVRDELDRCVGRER